MARINGLAAKGQRTSPKWNKEKNLRTKSSFFVSVGFKVGGIPGRITSRSYRMAYMVTLLALAVALTTALLLAGERSAPSPKKNVLQQSLHSTYSAVREKGDWGCAAA
jgi:hypothetical protein